ncbi:MAG: hypothetical protein H0X16_10935, partial [Chloroflexi bacterium]|nr:hypothetical protein [Chloroflexota bacterium]
MTATSEPVPPTVPTTAPSESTVVTEPSGASSAAPERLPDRPLGGWRVVAGKELADHLS